MLLKCSIVTKVRCTKVIADKGGRGQRPKSYMSTYNQIVNGKTSKTESFKAFDFFPL